MEILTNLRFEGTGRVEAWCPNHGWIQKVDIIKKCHPYNRDIIFCPDCKTALIRSEPMCESLCMNPHIHKTCDDECQIYTECMARDE